MTSARISARPSWSDRLESGVLVLIVLAVAGMAGAASFRHVHDWTMRNSPTGTGDWFGWANAMVSELIPLAAGLEIRRRRRLGLPAGRYPLVLVIGAMALSLTGQFAEAKPSVSGWLISAVPAVGFLALVKLALSRPVVPTAPATEGDSRTVVPDGPAPSPVIVPTVPGPSPLVDPNTTAVDQDPDGTDPATVELVALARETALRYQDEHGRPITRDALREALRVSNGTAGELLRTLRTTTPPDPAVRVNGYAIGSGVAR